VAGQLVALRSFFENQTILSIESFARGTAVVGGVTYPFLEFGGDLVLAGETVAIPTPTGDQVQVSTPFTFSGDLKGFEVLDPVGGSRFRIRGLSSMCRSPGTAPRRWSCSPEPRCQRDPRSSSCGLRTPSSPDGIERVE
jgi:hypothetical protein